jgi:serine O-acetyltransferase
MNYPDRVTFKDVRFLWWSDLYRRTGGKLSRWAFFRRLLLDPIFKFQFWFRLANYLRQRRVRRWHPILFFIACWMHRHYTLKYDIQIPAATQVGPGLQISHYGGIIVNSKVKIGRDCNITHNVTIGASQRGSRAGTPVLGDEVYLGPGAVIVGDVAIGDRAAVGANAVISRDIPPDGVAVGIPARVISRDGSAGYINETDYEERLAWYRGPFRKPPEPESEAPVELGYE